MLIEIIEDAPILLPNKEHKNFTKSESILPKGTIVEGDFKNVSGLRRGSPFNYRVFTTKEGDIIYSKYVKPMAVEVTMGADSQVSATKIEMIGSEKTTMSRKVIGAVVGGVVGYAVAKRGTSKSFTQQLMYIGGGALAGYLVGNYMNRKTGIVVEKAK
jgi:hypothetical protein